MQFVAVTHFSTYSADAEREFAEVFRVAHAASYLDAAEPFALVVESIEAVDRA